MSITIESIIARMEWAAARQLAEYSRSEDGYQITIRRTVIDTANISAPPVVSAPAPFVSADDGSLVAAPMAGLCHLKPEAGGKPFVQVGDTVEAGQTICIIEAMKMMTQIPSDRSGTVEAILVGDGDTVAAGAALIRIR